MRRNDVDISTASFPDVDTSALIGYRVSNAAEIATAQVTCAALQWAKPWRQASKAGSAKLDQQDPRHLSSLRNSIAVDVRELSRCVFRRCSCAERKIRDGWLLDKASTLGLNLGSAGEASWVRWPVCE